MYLVVFSGSRSRDLRGVVGEIERAEDGHREVDGGLELFLDLIRAAEDVGVVLREAADAGEAAQLAALLVAVDRPELGQADGQIAVGARLAVVDLRVVRAVHRLEQVALLVPRRVAEASCVRYSGDSPSGSGGPSSPSSIGGNCESE